MQVHRPLHKTVCFKKKSGTEPLFSKRTCVVLGGNAAVVKYGERWLRVQQVAVAGAAEFRERPASGDASWCAHEES